MSTKRKQEQKSKNKLQSCFNNFSKLILYITNGAYLLIGLLLVGSSLYFYFQDGKIFIFDLVYYSFTNNDNTHFAIKISVFIWLFLPLGLISFLFGIFGCSQVYRRKLCGESVFFVINAVIFVCLLAAFICIVNGVLTNPFDKEFYDTYVNEISLNQDDMGDNLFNQFEEFQMENSCCGLGNLETCYNWETGIPASCYCVNSMDTNLDSSECLPFPNTCNHTSNDVNAMSINSHLIKIIKQSGIDDIYSNSCNDTIQEQIGEIMGVLLWILIGVCGICGVSALFLIFVMAYG